MVRRRIAPLYGSSAIGTWSEVSCNEDLEGLVKEDLEKDISLHRGLFGRPYMSGFFNRDLERKAIFRLTKRPYLLCISRFVKQGPGNGHFYVDHLRWLQGLICREL